MALVDFDRQPVDAAVRFGVAPWAGLEALPLCKTQGTVVAAPDLVRRLPVSGAQDLCHHTLIHARGSHVDWDTAAATLGLARMPRKGDLVLDTDVAALRAAEQRLCVALGILPLIRPWLEARRLLALTPPIDLPMKLYFVFRQNESEARRAQLMRVHHWLANLFDALQGSPAKAA